LCEFANIGILALDVANQGLGFWLERKRFRRLREFFGDDAYRAYATAIEYLRIELAHLAAGDGFWSNWEPKRAFSHLTRRHESSIVFGEVRNLMSSDSVDEVVDELFGRLVMRQRQEGHDLDLIRDIRHELIANGIRSFRAIRMDDPVVPVTFPLAHRNGDLKAIHPLVFTQKTPLAVFDHGNLWKRRLKYLLEHRKIGERSILLAVEPPQDNNGSSIQSAYDEAMTELASLPFETVSAEVGGRVNQRIIEFAEAAQPRRFLN
jgi:hypothetical protein